MMMMMILMSVNCETIDSKAEKKLLVLFSHTK